ncbi:MAG: DUF4838 domain-containing protein [Planctomycetes bacterium]|nr:DUF4838 domain-containing protein [Planctomycetota bacterium]
MDSANDNHNQDWLILSPTGNFNSVDEAAMAEERIDWTEKENLDQEACTLSFASKEIVEHLHKISAVNFVHCDNLSSFSNSPERNGVIILAPHSFAESHELIKPFLDPIEIPSGAQAFLLRSFEIEKHRWYLVLGSDRAGALYGAYELLKSLSIRWFSPDPQGTDLPTSLPSPLPELNTSQSPSFLSRGFSGGNRGDRAFLLWMARNQLNLWTPTEADRAFGKKLCLKFSMAGHRIFGRYIPPEEYFEKHPEWYGLHNGQRQNRVDSLEGYNMCFSNAEARQKIAEALTEDLISGEYFYVDKMNIWPIDNGKWCECDDCQALGNPTNQLLLLIHDCNSEVRKARREGRLQREVEIAFLAYHETLPVPSRPLPEGFDHEHIIATFFPIERCYAHPFADPSCTEINQAMRDYWEAWTRPDCYFKGDMQMGEYYNVALFAGIPVVFMKILAADIPYYYATGARHMHYMHVAIADWGTMALTNYQYAALLWNHELDSATFLEDFMARRYREQAALMYEFYSLLEKAMGNAKALKHYTGMMGVNRHCFWSSLRTPASPENPVELFQTEHFPYAPRERTNNNAPSFLEMLEMLEEAKGMLDQALLECRDPEVALRLAADARRFRYGRKVVYFLYHFARLRMFENQGDQERAKLEAETLCMYGEALRRITRMVNSLSIRERAYKNGLTATWLIEAYEGAMAEYGVEIAVQGEATGNLIAPP